MEKVSKNIRAFIPLPALESQESYVERYTNAANMEAASTLEDKARITSVENAKELLAHAIRYELAEADRGSSITSRAQALLVAQTFFGALLAFATAIVGRADVFTGYVIAALVVLLCYTVMLVVMLTINALRATSGLRYRRTGTSDLVQWLTSTDSQFVASLAIGTLANYRQAGIVNTWRSMHLTYAQLCLRNIVFALAALVLVVFAAVIDGARRPAPDPLRWFRDPLPFFLPVTVEDAIGAKFGTTREYTAELGDYNG